ncbi:AAA family ATPase [Actinosynnema sp. NPDC023587]|uniref:AAA family ATPase n=1 Tax=Actinosynnema sp. NPDC023587 TaxID=3154695 RepID=UPI00340F77EA
MILALPAPVVVLLIGVAGSGKTTLAHALAEQDPAAAVLSFDDCRAELAGDAGDQSVTPAAVDLTHARLAERCAQHVSTVLDATSVRAEHRRVVLDLAAEHDVPVVAVVVDTPLETALARQLDRPATRQVPVEVVRAQHADLLASLSGLHTEGYAAVHLLRHPVEVPFF